MSLCLRGNGETEASAERFSGGKTKLENKEGNSA